MIPGSGSIKNLTFSEGEIDPPKENELQIEVKAVGLNFADIFAIQGLYSATPRGSFIPGLEYAGIVTFAGKNVELFQPGDRVMGVTKFGAYTTHLNIEERYLTHLPNDWSFEEGAAYPVQALTAYYSLVELGALKEGQTVLIHSAAGGVGLLANRIAKKMGAYTIGVVGSSSKLGMLKKEGYDLGMVRSKHFREELRTLLDDRPLHIVLECIGGHIFMDSYLNLSPEGRLITYGSAHYSQSGNRPNFIKLFLKYINRPLLDPQKMIEQNKSVMGFNLIWLYEQSEKMQRILKELKALDMDKPYVGHEFEFKDMIKAIKLFQTGQTMGKVIVKVG
ncbi:MAG: zinc-binding dehydrogenase [Cyclobacteriaceae bacterium]